MHNCSRWWQKETGATSGTLDAAGQQWLTALHMAEAQHISRLAFVSLMQRDFLNAHIHCCSSFVRGAVLNEQDFESIV